LVTVALLIYVGTELGISSWSSEYVVRVLGVSASRGAFTVAVLWLGLLVGRLGISFAYKGFRQELLMVALSVMSAAGLVAVLLSRSSTEVAVALFIAGLGCSGFYPLGMSVVGRHFKSGVAVGTAATGGAAGSIAFPFAMGFISQTIGIRRGFWLNLGLNLMLVVLAVLLVRQVRRGRAEGG
jgi:fucose permease